MQRCTTHTHECTNSNANIEINTRVHKNQENFHLNFPLALNPSSSLSSSFLLRSLYLAPPAQCASLCCFFLQGLCFPLPAVMLISAVIRREGLNAAFLTIPLRQTHRAEQSRTERERERETSSCILIVCQENRPLF